MLSLEDAWQRLLGTMLPLTRESVPLRDAVFRVLASDVNASSSMPPFDASAMDGYALDASTLPEQSPFNLRVVGQSRAGFAAPSLQPHTACRIFTGAPLPEGANAVVIQEDVTFDGTHITLQNAPQPGSNVRKRGEDLAAGSVALTQGTFIQPRHLGLLANLERTKLDVYRRPKVSILPTGDELRAAGDPPRVGSIVESSGIVLEAWANREGADARLSAPVADDAQALSRALSAAATTADMVITIGGVSVGDYDLVRSALLDLGGQLDFWKVRIRPGKPFALGTLGNARVFALPGNPVSAQLTFALFVLPALRKLAGRGPELPRRHSATLGVSVAQSPGRLGLLRATLSGAPPSWIATPLVGQSSGSVTSLAWADALILFPPEMEHLPQGATVDVLLLDAL